MKNKILLYGGLGTLGLAIAGVGIASAAGFGGGFGMGMNPMMGFGGTQTPAQAAANLQTEFQNEATITGLPLATIVSGWAQGQSLMQVAQANGVSTSTLQANLKSFRVSQLKSELDALVANGTITQAQADARLQFETNRANQPKPMGMMGKHGHGRGPWKTGATTTPSSQ